MNRLGHDVTIILVCAVSIVLGFAVADLQGRVSALESSRFPHAATTALLAQPGREEVPSAAVGQQATHGGSDPDVPSVRSADEGSGVTRSSDAPDPATASREAVAPATPRELGTAAPILPPATYVLTADEVYEVALAASGSPAWAREAVAVSYCESRHRPDAVGALGERGAWQVRPEYHGPVPADALGQAEQAYRVWSEAGWHPWSCRP